ncbi:uncharacterized protein METZ01_LOCUS369845, partial [marine metagenome]
VERLCSLLVPHKTCTIILPTPISPVASGCVRTANPKHIKVRPGPQPDQVGVLFYGGEIMPATTKDQQGLRDINVNATERLMPPSELLSEFPLTGIAEETVLKGREAIRKVLDGTDGRFIIIAGPCSIHDYDTALEYADRLRRLTQPLSDRLLTVMRVYFEKPRTTVGWKGLLYDPDLNDSFDIAT